MSGRRTGIALQNFLQVQNSATKPNPSGHRQSGKMQALFAALTILPQACVFTALPADTTDLRLTFASPRLDLKSKFCEHGTIPCWANFLRTLWLGGCYALPLSEPGRLQA